LHEVGASLKIFLKLIIYYIKIKKKEFKYQFDLLFIEAKSLNHWLAHSKKYDYKIKGRKYHLLGLVIPFLSNSSAFFAGGCSM
jgi:hypothetical protein